MLVNLIDEHGIKTTTLPDGSRYVESFRFAPEDERQYLGPANRLPPADLTVDNVRVPITEVCFQDRSLIPEELVVDRVDGRLYVAVVGHSRFVIHLQNAVLEAERATFRETQRVECSKRRTLENSVRNLKRYAAEVHATAMAERKKWWTVVLVSNLIATLIPVLWYEVF